VVEKTVRRAPCGHGKSLGERCERSPDPSEVFSPGELRGISFSNHQLELPNVHHSCCPHDFGDASPDSYFCKTLLFRIFLKNVAPLLTKASSQVKIRLERMRKRCPEKKA
jgi:hypothetical protein